MTTNTATEGMNAYEIANLEWSNATVFERRLLMCGIGSPEMSDEYVMETPWGQLGADWQRQLSALISYRETILNR